MTVYLDDLYERVTHPGTGVVEHRYTIHSSERAIAIVTRQDGAPSTTLYAHVDHLGSVDALSDEQGKLVEKRSYDAFGARRNPLWGQPPPPSFSALTTQGFTWHESDDELGLVNMKGRIYDPKVGRFLTADPIVGDPGAGQEWNPYGYVGNNPLTYIDPSGFSETGPPPDDAPLNCEDQGRLCGSHGSAVGSTLEVVIHGTKRAPRAPPPAPKKAPKEEATELGAAGTPTDVTTAGTAVAFVPTPDATATKPLAGRVGRFLFGIGKAYGEQVLDTGTSLALNFATFGAYSAVKLWWRVGQGIADGIERRDFGDAWWQVGLSGVLGGVNSVNPLWGLVVNGIHGIEAVEQGDDEKLGEAVEPVLVAIVAIAVTGKLAGAEAGAAEAEEAGAEAAGTRGGTYILRNRSTGQVMRTGRTNDLARRAAEHARDPALRELEFEEVDHTDVYAEQRGLEQNLHDQYNPPMNKIRPISPTNSRWQMYMDAAKRFLER